MMKLKLPSCTVRIEKNGKVLFFNTDIPSWVVTDMNGGAILSACDGSMSREEIVDCFKLEFGEEQSALIDRFLSKCVDSRLFEVPKQGEIPIIRNNGRLSIIQLSLSSKCNLNCKYCYATDRIESKYPKMTLSDYQRVVDEICDFSKYAKFTLTGGEPLLNPNCIDVAKYIKLKGHYVDLLTNATLVNDALADKIKDFFDKVTISLDGSSKELHELFRGSGTHERTCKNIDLLVQKGVEVGLSMTVNRLNIHDVGAMAEKYGGIFHFAPLFPLGNATKTD